MTWIRFRRQAQAIVNQRLTHVAWWWLAVALLMQGCSLTGFGYGMVPTWAMWQLDSWLALDEDQRLMARGRIDELHQWHRAEQLPQYATLLREVDARMRSGLDMTDLARWRTQALDSWQPFARQAAPAVAELLQSLKPEQVERLRTRIADSNRKWLRENAVGDPAKALAARDKRYLERAEFFFGDLTRDQQHALRTEVAAMAPVHEVMLAERESRQQRLLALIERLRSERPSAEVARQWCESYLAGLWVSSDRERQARIDQSVLAGDRLSLSTWSRTNEAQRRHLSGKLREYAEQATVLASAR